MPHRDEPLPRGPGLHASWQVLGSKPCDALVEPRVTVERAVRAVGHVALRLAPPEERIGELEWLSDHHALATAVLRGSQGCRVALRPAELTLLLLDTDGTTLRTCPLERCTVADAFDWLRVQLGEFGIDTQGALEPSLASVPLPDDSLGCPDREALAELERWLVNADHVLRRLARTTHGASPVRCPADRLELSTEIRHTTREGEVERCVVVGVSLGDDRRPEPHFFVEALPASLEAQGWETAGQAKRTVLPGTAILGGRDAEAQAASVDQFLQEAIAEGHALVQREWRRR